MEKIATTQLNQNISAYFGNLSNKKFPKKSLSPPKAKVNQLSYTHDEHDHNIQMFHDHQHENENEEKIENLPLEK